MYRSGDIQNTYSPTLCAGQSNIFLMLGKNKKYPCCCIYVLILISETRAP